MCPLGYHVVSSASQCHSAKHVSNLCFFYITDEYVGEHTVRHRSYLLLNEEVCRVEAP